MTKVCLQQKTSQSTQTVRPFGMKDKLGYMFGDFGNDFFFILVAAFLMVFYTDVFHINPAAVGGLFLVARLWDAFADVTWGRFIDTRKAGKNGKFKPWIFRMSFPTCNFWCVNVCSHSRNVRWILSCICICNLYFMGNII